MKFLNENDCHMKTLMNMKSISLIFILFITDLFTISFSKYQI